MRTLPILALLCFCVLIGCASDISKNPSAYKINYKVGTTYRLKQPVFLERYSSGMFTHKLLLYRPDPLLAGKPKSVEEFLASDKPKWGAIIGVVDANTDLKVERITRRYNVVVGNMYDVEARVLNGTHAKKKVDLKFVSHRDSWEPQVDPDYLEVVR